LSKIAAVVVDSSFAVEVPYSGAHAEVEPSIEVFAFSSFVAAVAVAYS